MIYHCDVCGNLIEVIDEGVGTLECCGQPMLEIVANTTEAASEKHVPVVVEVDGKINVTVGSVEHPMTEDHYIEWIEVVFVDRICRFQLKPSDKPAAAFCASGKKYSVRAYCNLHGLWQ